MRHPYHPQHPFTMIFADESGTLVSTNNITDYFNYIYTHGCYSIDAKCDWCGQGVGTIFRRCSICSFILDEGCWDLNPSLTISNPRSHDHDLALLPRPFLTPCDACGVVDARDPPYACLQCNYVVHRSCINLPRVIKIMYHPHRLSHTPHLPHRKWPCGICHGDIDVKYGAYSCKRGCPSVFHSKCATREGVWDGKELEWEPEEPEDPKDLEPFEKVGDKEILHFSHEHHLWLNGDGIVHDANKQCQACVLPVDSDDFYSCLECDFILHATCANLPRKKEHVLHHHPLILDPLPPPNGAYSTECSACKRIFSGFKYKCKECRGFSIDVRCASISSPFSHRSHQHPLFIHHFDREPLTNKSPCAVCGSNLSCCYLNCIDGCNFKLCFECATFPDEVRYKYDEHLLTLCCGEDSSRPYWCEVCERELNPKEWFYTCNECSFTLHVPCVFGSSMYMKYGDHNLKFRCRELDIVRNCSSTRPVCSECRHRCGDTVFYKDIDEYFCSIKCITYPL